MNVSVCRPLPAAALAALFTAGALPATAQLLAAGDPSPDGAVLWTRVDEPGAYRFELAEDAHFGKVVDRLAVRTTKDVLTAQATARGLKPETRYYYRIADASGPLPARASFVTAPLPVTRASAKILFGNCVGGTGGGLSAGLGRLRPGTGLKVDGFPIFEPMRAEGADFFLALGDMIYSDRPITAEAPRPFPKGNDWQIPKPGPGYVTNLSDFRREWLYYRDDRAYAGFLRATPLVATWDDHEIVNDSGGPELTRGPTTEELARDGRLRQGDPSRPRGEVVPWSKSERRRSVFFNPPLYAAARQAMFEWNPIAVLPDPSGANPRRLYRSLRWGAHVEVFVLDTRSYRDPRYRIDSDAAPKTMLGAAQKRWLLEGLARSDATWKVVVSSVPLSIATGNERDLQGRHYRDAWAAGQSDNPYGYGRELKEIVAALRDRKVANVLFLTGDQHYSNLFAYDPDGDGHPDFHEANIGALRAGGQGQNEVIDAGLNPKRLFTDAGKASFAYGAVHVDGEAGRLTVSFHGEDGAPLSGARLVLEPASR